MLWSALKSMGRGLLVTEHLWSDFKYRHWGQILLHLKPVIIRRKSSNSASESWGNGEMSWHRIKPPKPGPCTTWNIPAVPTERGPSTSSINTASICLGEPLTSTMSAARLHAGHVDWRSCWGHASWAGKWCFDLFSCSWMLLWFRRWA